MFVTTFIGILNVKTGEFLYVNGGHNRPLLWENSSEPSFLKNPGGPLVGLMEDAVFVLGRRTFTPGTVFLAYSDGVTEAFNSDGEAFSDERLLEVVAPVRQMSVKEITEVLLADIDSFCVGAPQSDDITILALRFGSEVTTTG